MLLPVLLLILPTVLEVVPALPQAAPVVRNKLATKLVILKVHNVKLSFDIWLILYMYFILYF